MNYVWRIMLDWHPYLPMIFVQLRAIVIFSYLSTISTHTHIKVKVNYINISMERRAIVGHLCCLLLISL